MKSKSLLKLPSQLNLGIILPGQYGEAVLPLRSSAVAFLNLTLSQKAVNGGFFLLKEESNDCKSELNIVTKPGVTYNVIVASYGEQLFKSTSFSGELIVTEEENSHTIKIFYRVELPKILCKKVLQHFETKERMIRIIINKAITGQGRVMLQNLQDYRLELKPGLLQTNTISDKNSPYLMKVQSDILQVDPKEQFIIFVSVTTNIGFKKDFKGMKKCVLRNVLTLKTNSTVFWCLPIEVIIIFVKQPQMKE